MGDDDYITSAGILILLKIVRPVQIKSKIICTIGNRLK
jgi:hypothetical protein